MAKKRAPNRNRGSVTQWQHHHLASARDSLARLRTQPIAFAITLLMISVAFALPTGLYMLFNSFEQVVSSWDQGNEISIFLKANVSESAGKELADHLASRESFDNVTLISADQALQEFRAQSDLGPVLDSLDDNPLPHLLVAIPSTEYNDVGKLETLAAELEEHSKIDYVQIDLLWIQRLEHILTVIYRILLALAVMLVTSVILVIANSIRWEIESRREEINIVKLIGATNAYVRRPFLYSGVWLGSLGALLALLLVFIVLWFMDGPVTNLAALYGTEFHLVRPSLLAVVGLLSFGTAVGIAGAWIAVGRQLRLTKSTNE